MQKLIIFLFIFSLIFPVICYAESDLTPPMLLEVGYEFASFHYEEPGIMDEDGILHGLRGEFTVHNLNNIMWRVMGRFSAGGLDYDGKTWGGTPLTMDTDIFVLSLRGLLGRDFNLGNSIITPLIGLGYRYWNDDSSGNTAGYEREIKYLYSPIGFETASLAREDWIWGIRAEYDLFWRGKATSHLGDAVTGLSDADNNQKFGDGYGLRGSLYLRRSQKVNWPFSIEVFVRYWDIEKSDIAPISYYGWLVGYGVEPANNTTEYGLKFSLLW